METKINIAAILKNKPQGTKLWSSISNDECKLEEITECSIVVDMNDNGRLWPFSFYGSTFSFSKGEVLLFPSKEMRDWSKFAWKKGDVLISNDGKRKKSSLTDSQMIPMPYLRQSTDLKSFLMGIPYILRMKMVLQRMITLSKIRMMLRHISILSRNVWAET